MSKLTAVFTDDKNKSEIKKEITNDPNQGNLFGFISGASSQKGKQARIGNKFEKEIEDVCSIYEEKQIAYIQKFTPPTVFVPSKKKGEKGFFIHNKKTGFDFVGGIVPTKEAVFIEVKTTEEPMIDVGAENKGIKIHQIERMLWLQEVGFKVFFLWEIRKKFLVYMFTPTQLLEAIEGKKFLSGIKAEEHKFRKIIKIPYHGNSYYDFLGVL